MPELAGIEEYLPVKLTKDPMLVDGAGLLEFYKTEKARLGDVYELIAKKNPGFNDHGEKHVNAVLIKTARLLKHDGNLENNYFNAAEFFILCLATIYHDTGMVFVDRDADQDRDGHQLRVRDVLSELGPRKRPQEETDCFIYVIEGHTGILRDGSRDVIPTLEDPGYCHDNCIRIRELAAVLRLADEISEGHHRIIPFQIDANLIDTKNEFHHISCEGVKNQPNPGRQQINVTHDVNIDRIFNWASRTDKTREQALSEYLDFLYKKTSKINANRLYTKYFTSVLEPYKKLFAVFRFWKGGRELDIQINPVIYDDKKLVGEDDIPLYSIAPNYEPATLVPKLLEKYDGDEYKPPF